MPVERIARLVEAHIVGKLHRQILLRHRHDAASRAMDHRDRTAPITLPRDAPVAQTILRLPLGDRPALHCLFGESVGDGGLGVLDAESVEKAGIDQRAVARIGLLADGEARRIGIWRQHDRDDRQTLGAGEFEVALVVRRAAEDRARAVLHDDEIRDQHGKLGALDHRMTHAQAGVEALLLLRLELGGGRAVPLAFGDEVGGAGILLGDGLGQRMIRRDGDEARAEQRIWPRGEHLDQVVALGRRARHHLEADEQALPNGRSSWPASA